MGFSSTQVYDDGFRIGNMKRRKKTGREKHGEKIEAKRKKEDSMIKERKEKEEKRGKEGEKDETRHMSKINK